MSRLSRLFLPDQPPHIIQCASYYQINLGPDNELLVSNYCLEDFYRKFKTNLNSRISILFIVIQLFVWAFGLAFY